MPCSKPAWTTWPPSSFPDSYEYPQSMSSSNVCPHCGQRSREVAGVFVTCQHFDYISVNGRSVVVFRRSGPEAALEDGAAAIRRSELSRRSASRNNAGTLGRPELYRGG